VSATVAAGPGGEDGPELKLWLGISLALHLLLAVAGFIYGAVRPFEEPEELRPVAVEFAAPEPPAQARGERPGPAPDPVPAPPEPAPTPLPPTPPRPEPPQPAPPPPPPPPAPAPAPTPVPPAPVPPAPVPPAAAPPIAAAPPPVAPTPARPTTPPVPVVPDGTLPPPPAPPVPRPTPPTPTPAAPSVTPPTPAPPRPATPTPPAATPARPEPALPLPPPPAPPPPNPAQTPGTGQTPPVARPEERSNAVLSTLERLRAVQAQQAPPTGRPNPQAGRPTQGGGAPTGTDLLNAGERGAIGERIGECWRVDPGMLGLADMRVSLVAIVDRAGVIRNVLPGPDGVPGDPRGQTLYERARRALLDPACSPLPVPAGRLTAAENRFQFNFSPRGFIR